MKHHAPSRHLGLIALVALAGTCLCLAGLPRQADNYVNDFADLLSPAESSRLTTTLRSFESRSGVRMTVVTVESFGQYGTGDGSIEAFATRLFNHWGIGNADRNDGVMVLVAKNDRKLRIEVGSGYDQSWDQRATSIIDRKIVPEFKRGNFGKGIENGVAAMIAAIDGQAVNAQPAKAPQAPAETNRPRPQGIRTTDPSLAESELTDPAMTAAEAEQAPLAPAPAATPTRSPHAPVDVRPGNSGFRAPLGIIGTAIGGLGALIAGAFGISRLVRRKCPHCQAEMKAAADAGRVLPLLSESEQLEQRLGSMNHRLFECTRCDHHEVVSSTRWFSGFKPCKACRVRALRETKQTLRRSTRMTRGEELITCHCEHCGFHDETTRLLPLIASSTSSSGSSFGGGGGGGSSNSGGSSSGGGGSGSW